MFAPPNPHKTSVRFIVLTIRLFILPPFSFLCFLICWLIKCILIYLQRWFQGKVFPTIKTNRQTYWLKHKALKVLTFNQEDVTFRSASKAYICEKYD